MRPLSPLPASQPAPRCRSFKVLWLIGAVTALPELVLLGADLGLWGSTIWRPLAYQWGGFWAGLWHGWQPNYPAQPYAMLALYPFLHAGPGHLIGNLAGLWVVGGVLLGRMGAGGVAVVWAGGALVGGAMFGLLATTAAPMVGASGAVFALAGAWGWFDAMSRTTALRCAGRALGLVAFGVAVNLAMVVFTPGGIAWETHLGGALAGVVLAMGYKWKRAAR